MLNLRTLSNDAFREFALDTVTHEWHGTATPTRSASVWNVSVPSGNNLDQPAGVWTAILVPGTVPTLSSEDLSPWLVNYLIRELESSQEKSFAHFSGPPALFFAADEEIVSAVQGPQFIRRLQEVSNSRTADYAAEAVSASEFQRTYLANEFVRRAFRAADPAAKDAMGGTASGDKVLDRTGAAIVKLVRRQLRHASGISLTQAGGAGDENARLADIFKDARARPWEAVAGENTVGFCSHYLEVIDRPLLAHSVNREGSRRVLVGGPGQGKSTISQFIAQFYRAAYLLDLPDNSREVEEIAKSVLKRGRELGIRRPLFHRTPLEVSLARYAEYLATRKASRVDDNSDREARESDGVLAYLAHRDEEMTLHGLKRWLREWPCVLLLDGMDETPPELRDDIRREIEECEQQAFELGADLAILVTTRPQGAVTDFSSERWSHDRLEDLTTPEAKAYANAILGLYNNSGSEDLDQLRVRVLRAIETPPTNRIARTPLQVTILCMLYQQNVDAQSRFDLFDGYFSVVFRREANKRGTLGEFVRSNKQVLEQTHERVADELERRSEKGRESYLTSDELTTILGGVLEARGYRANEILTAKLKSAMVDRLVLLVSPIEDQWRFEVRLIQEYMTARHWTSGQDLNDNELNSLLSVSAPLQFWRTVWSLAAGRILSDRTMYRALLLDCIASQNTGNHVRLGASPGSFLSLDLLVDDVASDRPGDTQTLLTTAFRGLQDFSADEIIAISEVFLRLLRKDRAYEQMLNALVGEIGPGWSLRGDALSAAFRAMRGRTAEHSIRVMLDRWLRQLGNATGHRSFVYTGKEIPLHEVLTMAGIEGMPGYLKKELSKPFELWTDSLGRDFVLERGADVSVAISERLKRPNSASALAEVESQLRLDHPYLAQQIRRALLYRLGRGALDPGEGPSASS